jgi:hypothetical protein
MAEAPANPNPAHSVQAPSQMRRPPFSATRNKITNPTWLCPSAATKKVSPTRRGQDVLRWRKQEANAEKGDHCRCAGCPVRFLPELIPSYCAPMEKSYSYRRISDQGGRGAGRGEKGDGEACACPRGGVAAVGGTAAAA